MIPKGFQHDHFLKAANAIRKKGVPASRQSYRYDLLLNGEKYPPIKFILNKIKKALNKALKPFAAPEARLRLSSLLCF
jgi:hypothetical protein